MNTADNQRYRDNERHLILTMLHLMERYEYATITVTRLCKVAGLHRSTFYTHFKDIDDLLVHILNYLSDEQDALIRNHPEQRFPQEIIRMYLNAVRERHYFYRILYGRPTFGLSRNRQLYVWERVIEPWFLHNSIGQAYRDTFYHFFFYGFTAIMRRWLENGCDTDTEMLAAMIMDFIPASLKAGSIEDINQFELQKST